MDMKLCLNRLVMMIGLLATGSTQGQILAGNATYVNGLLTIPLVDSPELPGFVQDAKLQQTSQGDWRLIEYKGIQQYLNSTYITPALVEKVELVKTDSMPVQVFLKVSGVNNGCDATGRAPQRRKGNTIEVTLYSEGPPHPETVICLAALFPFSKVIPLDVYGLAAGSYSYELKAGAYATGGGKTTKVFSGTFVLAKDNVL